MIRHVRGTTHFDMRAVEPGEGLRVGDQLYVQVSMADGAAVLRCACGECGRQFDQRVSLTAAVSVVARRCDACRRAGRWVRAGRVARSLRGVRDDSVTSVLLGGLDLMGRDVGDVVRYRGRDYVVVRRDGYVRGDGSVHDRYDVQGTCAVCGSAIVVRAEDDSTRLALRCPPCMRETGRSWRYREGTKKVC